MSTREQSPLGPAPGFEGPDSLDITPAPGFEEMNSGDQISTSIEFVDPGQLPKATIDTSVPDVELDIDKSNTPVTEWTEQGFGNKAGLDTAVGDIVNKAGVMKKALNAIKESGVDDIDPDRLNPNSTLLAGVTGGAKVDNRTLLEKFFEDVPLSKAAPITRTAEVLEERAGLFVSRTLAGLSQAGAFIRKGFYASVNKVLGSDIFAHSILAAGGDDTIGTHIKNFLEASIKSAEEDIQYYGQAPKVQSYLERQSQRYAQLYNKGDTAEIVSSMVSDTIVDTTLAVTLGKGITGSWYGSTAPIAQTLQRAGAIGAFRFVASPGSIQERAKTAAISMAYMATPAISGNVPTQLGAKLSDFVLNSFISFTGLGITKAPAMEAIREGFRVADERGYSEEYGLKLAMINLIPVVGSDVWFSAMTQSMREGHTVGTTVESMRKAVTNAKPKSAAESITEMKPPPYLKDAGSGDTSETRSAYMENWKAEVAKLIGDPDLKSEDVDRINMRKVLGLNLSPNRLNGLEREQFSDNYIQAMKHVQEVQDTILPTSDVSKAQTQLKSESLVRSLIDPDSALNFDKANAFTEGLMKDLQINDLSARGQAAGLLFFRASAEHLALDKYLKDNAGNIDVDVLRGYNTRLGELATLMDNSAIGAKAFAQFTGRNLQALSDKISVDGVRFNPDEYSRAAAETAAYMSHRSIWETIREQARAAALTNVPARVYTEFVAPVSIGVIEAASQTVNYASTMINRHVFKNYDPTQMSTFEYKTYMKSSVTEIGDAFKNFGKLSWGWLKTATNFKTGGFTKANQDLQKAVEELGTRVTQDAPDFIDPSSMKFLLNTRTGQITDKAIQALDNIFGADNKARDSFWKGAEQLLQANKSIMSFIGAADFSNTNAFLQVKRQELLSRFVNRKAEFGQIPKEVIQKEYSRLNDLMLTHKEKDVNYFKDLSIEEQALFDQINKDAKTFAMEATMKGELTGALGNMSNYLREHPFIAMMTKSLFFKAPVNTVKYTLERLPLMFPGIKDGKFYMYAATKNMRRRLNAVTADGTPDKAERAKAYSDIAVVSGMVLAGVFGGLGEYIVNSTEFFNPEEYSRSKVTGIPLGTNIKFDEADYLNINRADVVRLSLGIGSGIGERVIQKWMDLASEDNPEIVDYLAPLLTGITCTAIQVISDTPAFMQVRDMIRLVNQTASSVDRKEKLKSQLSDYGINKLAGLGLLNSVLSTTLFSSVMRSMDATELKQVETLLDNLRTNIAAPTAKLTGIDYDNPTVTRQNALGDPLSTAQPTSLSDYLFHSIGFRTEKVDVLDALIDKLEVNFPRFDGRFYQTSARIGNAQKAMVIDLKNVGGKDISKEFKQALGAKYKFYGNKTIRGFLTDLVKRPFFRKLSDANAKALLQQRISAHYKLVTALKIRPNKDIQRDLIEFRKQVIDEARRNEITQKTIDQFLNRGTKDVL